VDAGSPGSAAPETAGLSVNMLKSLSLQPHDQDCAASGATLDIGQGRASSAFADSEKAATSARRNRAEAESDETK
jgi:hypothetical protein